MSLIIKKSFVDLISKLTTLELNNYLGMGNPNADILLVGTEKALDPTKPVYASIINHELTMNLKHWQDILSHYNSLKESLDSVLLTRPSPLSGFNPFNPLLFPSTRKIVSGRTGHTYYGLQRLINQYEVIHSLPATNILEQGTYKNCTFSRCFITEISADPARTQREAKFKLSDFFVSSRFSFMTGLASDFYTSFKTVLIYAGKNARYVGKEGTPNRLKIIQMFNPTLDHKDLKISPQGYIYYDNSKGARVILCRHLAAGFSNIAANEIAKSMI
jgi:hypothetical protein